MLVARKIGILSVCRDHILTRCGIGHWSAHKAPSKMHLSSFQEAKGMSHSRKISGASQCKYEVLEKIEPS